MLSFLLKLADLCLVMKPSTIYIAGHVDAGKSTLMGHLLYQLGNVNKRLMHKYEQESKKVGKSSFAYAWVLDETEEERFVDIIVKINKIFERNALLTFAF